MRWRLELLRQIGNDLRGNRPVTAKQIGKMTQWLDNRIKTHDYSKEDELLRKFPLK